MGGGRWILDNTSSSSRSRKLDAALGAKWVTDIRLHWGRRGYLAPSPFNSYGLAAEPPAHRRLHPATILSKM